MEQKLNELRPEISSFVESLRHVLQAEDECFSAFGMIYGDTPTEEGGKTGGERMFYSTGLSEGFEEIKNLLKSQIGEVVELDLRNLLGDSEVEVC